MKAPAKDYVRIFIALYKTELTQLEQRNKYRSDKFCNLIKATAWEQKLQITRENIQATTEALTAADKAKIEEYYGVGQLFE